MKKYTNNTLDPESIEDLSKAIRYCLSDYIDLCKSIEGMDSENAIKKSLDIKRRAEDVYDIAVYIAKTIKNNY